MCVVTWLQLTIGYKRDINASDVFYVIQLAILSRTQLNYEHLENIVKKYKERRFHQEIVLYL